MKILFSAIVLTLAVPAYAQTTPATDPHAGHSMPAGMDHSQHQQGKHDCKECCEKMKGKDAGISRQDLFQGLGRGGEGRGGEGRGGEGRGGRGGEGRGGRGEGRAPRDA